MSPRRLEERWVRRVPPGDSIPRLICDSCGFIRYENPKLVVGAVVTEGERYLMCRRAIEPRKGYWTLPAGFMELGEGPAEGAAREAREEACAEIAIDGLLAVYTIRHIGQVQMIFRARLTSGIEAGPESEAVALLRWEEIPWSEIAFPSVHWALHQHRQVGTAPLGAPFGNPVGEDGRLGA
jgi:ADP-ribose pyrophosphatase YjhB (NUDIX family)